MLSLLLLETGLLCGAHLLSVDLLNLVVITLRVVTAFVSLVEVKATSVALDGELRKELAGDSGLVVNQLTALVLKHGSLTTVHVEHAGLVSGAALFCKLHCLGKRTRVGATTKGNVRSH